MMPRASCSASGALRCGMLPRCGQRLIQSSSCLTPRLRPACLRTCGPAATRGARWRPAQTASMFSVDMAPTRAPLTSCLMVGGRALVHARDHEGAPSPLMLSSCHALLAPAPPRRRQLDVRRHAPVAGALHARRAAHCARGAGSGLRPWRNTRVELQQVACGQPARRQVCATQAPAGCVVLRRGLLCRRCGALPTGAFAAVRPCPAVPDPAPAGGWRWRWMARPSSAASCARRQAA